MAIDPRDVNKLDALLREVHDVLDTINQDWGVVDGYELEAALEDALGEFATFRRRHALPTIALLRRQRRR